MSKITYPDKNTGDQFTAAEATQIKTVVNANDDGHDYKIWYVDGNNGLGTNKGSRGNPVKTLQEGIDLREADGALRGTIDIVNIEFSGMDAVIASNPTWITVLKSREKLSQINNLTVTDTTIYLDGMVVDGLFTANQTSTNQVTVSLFQSARINNYAESVVTADKCDVYLYDNSYVRWTLADATTYKTRLFALNGSLIQFEGFSTATLPTIEVTDAGLNSGVGFTVDILKVTRSFITLNTSQAVTVNTTFTRLNSRFYGFDTIDSSGATTQIFEDSSDAFNALGAFTPAMTFDSEGDHDNYTLVSDIVLSASSIVAGKYRAVYITQSSGQTFKISLGTGVSKISSNVDVDGNNQYTLLPGSYMHHMASLRAGPSDPTPAIQINVPEGNVITQQPPSIISLAVGLGSLKCEMFFNKATFANDDATGNLQLTDFGTATLTGGTATLPVLSNPVHVAGDSSITFDLSYTGTANGAEVLEIPVAGATSIYDVEGTAMSASESGTDNLTIIVMQDDFAGVTIDTNKWSPVEGSANGTITQNDNLIFTYTADVPNRQNYLPSDTDCGAVSAAQITASGTTATSGYNFKLWDGTQVSEVSIGPQGDKSLIRLIIRKADASVYDESVAISANNTFKILKEGDDYSFWYLSAPDTWTILNPTTLPETVTGMPTLHPNLEQSNQTGTGTINLDDYYQTNGKYDTSVPV